MSVVSIITCTPLYAGESELERLKSGFKNKIQSELDLEAPRLHAFAKPRFSKLSIHLTQSYRILKSDI